MTTKTNTEAPVWMMAREAVVVFVGAKAAVYQTAIVRDRHTGALAEVPLTEYEPLEPADEGKVFVFSRGEKVLSDHPAVIESPGSFVPYVKPPED